MNSDLQLRVSFFFILTLLAAGGGIFTMSRFASHTQADLAQLALRSNSQMQITGDQALSMLNKSAGDGMSNVFLVNDLQDAFLDQMLQWKNLLVRGEFNDMRERYLTVLKDGNGRIAILLGQVKEVFINDPEAKQLVEQVEVEYLNFRKQVEVAQGMMAFHDTYAEGIRAADQYTGDRGVATIGLIKELAMHEGRRVKEAITRTTRTATLQSQETAGTVTREVTDIVSRAGRRSMLVATMAGGVVMAICVLAMYLLRRTVIHPIMQINERLQVVVGMVAQEAAQLLSVSKELEAGAGQQASSLEETGSSVEELAARSAANSDSARQVSIFSAANQLVVMDGKARMDRMTEAMAEIATASGAVITITKDIDEIAFQTNLLSLNAAVEAARAGKAGAGFSVVAAEIRQLSRRVAGLAQEAEEISEKARARIDQGRELCQSLGAAFAEINRGIGKVDEEVKGIASASQEQALGVGQVNLAISAIDAVGAAATVRAGEAAGMAEDLEAQAMELAAISRTLVHLVKGEGGNSEPSTVSALSLELPSWQAAACSRR